MKLREVFRHIGERFLRRWHSGGSNGVTPYVPPTPPCYPVPEDWNPFGNWTENPIYVQSEATFYRNLPELLKKHEGKFVCYRGEECIGIARTETELWKRCYRRGWKPGEFFVGFIYTGALYDKNGAPSADEVPWAEEEVYRMNPLYARSQEAFYRNYADLMKKHEGEWVAYHGDEYVVAAKTKDEAWNDCLRRGLKPGEFAVLFVHDPERMDYNTELGWAGEL